MNLETPPSQNPHTARTRDAALRRLAHANRWLIAGSAALTGAFTAVAANAFPGRVFKPTTAGSAAHPSSTTRSSASHAGGALKPPAQAPRSSETPTTNSPAPATSPESAPARESTPAPETTVAPTQESPPVTSGGS
jgi:hypothetical protein